MILLHSQTCQHETKFLQQHFKLESYRPTPLNPLARSLLVSPEVFRVLGFHLPQITSGTRKEEEEIARTGQIPLESNREVSPVERSFRLQDQPRQIDQQESITNFFNITTKIYDSVVDNKMKVKRFLQSRYFLSTNGIGVGFDIKQLRRIINQPAQPARGVRIPEIRMAHNK